MEKGKIPISEKGEKTEPKLEYFYKYKGHPMVRFSGNFMGGGFSLSKGKVAAVLKVADQLKKFVDGGLDAEIEKLAEDEMLKP